MKFYHKDKRAFSRRKLVEEVLKKPYKQATILMNKETIRRFIRPEWHRRFREPHVRNIMTSLIGGVHFSEGITVNFKEDNYRVINGNHRVEAVRRVIAQFPEFSVEASITSYIDLSLEDERDLYTLINTTKAESMDDFLRSHCHDAEIFLLMKKKFPCTVDFYSASANSRNYFHFSTLVRPYLERNSISKVSVGYRREYLVKQIKEMDETDYDRIREFVEFFISTFGEPNPDNVYAQAGKVNVISKIFYTEQAGIGSENLSKRFKELMMKKPQLFFERVTATDYDSYYNRLVDELNKIKKFDRGEIFNIIKQGVRTEVEVE